RGRPSTYLQPPQPAREVDTGEQESPTGWWGDCIREGLRQRSPLEVEIGPCVAHGGVKSSVPEPLADGGEVHPGLEQRHRGAVPDRVRVQPLGLEGRSDL